MRFEPTERIIAIAPADMQAAFEALSAIYAEPLPDGNRTITTIGAHWDNADQTRIRAASLTDGTITPQPLTDGRVAFIALWQSDLAAAFDNGEIEGVEQLTPDMLAELTPNSPDL